MTTEPPAWDPRTGFAGPGSEAPSGLPVGPPADPTWPSGPPSAPPPAAPYAPPPVAYPPPAPTYPPPGPAQGAPPPYGPPPGYGAVPTWGGGYPPPYGYGQPEHPQGTTLLVMGILSLVLIPVCYIGLLIGPVTLALSIKPRREVNAHPGLYRNASQVTAGWVMGIISTILLGCVIVLYAVIFGVAASSSGG